jgi:LCP family protein required for cell wall assembly
MLGTYFYSKFDSFYKSIFSKNSQTKVIPAEKTSWNILFLGYGGFKEDGTPHDGTYLTDTIISVNINTKTKKVTLISIPRDLWVKLPTKSGEDFYAKLNSVYQNELFPETFPDVKSDNNLTKNVIGNIVGQPIDSIVAIDFYGFKRMIDVIDGIDVTVEKTFDDNQYPIDGKEADLCGKTDEEYQKLLPELEATDSPELVMPCRFEKLHFDKGVVHMDGDQALKYARSRHSNEDGGDFARAARQQKVIEAVKSKMFSIGFISKVVPLLDEMKKHIKTDITSEEINRLSKEAIYTNQYTIDKIVLSDQNYLKDSYSQNGQWILISKDGINNFTTIKKEIKNSLLGITPTPIATGSSKIKN